MTYGNYPDLKEVKKIVVIKMRHHGDVLLSSPVFSNLKNRIPHASIDAFVYKDTLPMLEGHPAISDFLLYDRGWKKLSKMAKLRKELTLLRQIRKNGYDLVINLTEGDRGALAAWISGARIRVGFDPEGKGFLGKKRAYTHMVKNCKTPRHTVEKNLDALRCIGIFPAVGERDLTFHLPPTQICPHDDYILIHPVSRWRFKCWPTSHVATLMRELHLKGYKLALTASPDPHELAMTEEILRYIPEIPVHNFAGKTSLKELGSLVAKAQLLICVDSVPLHMASATKTPTVVLFGPTSEQNWGPWMNPKGRVVSKEMSCRPCFMDGCGGSKMSDCLHSLSVKTVLHAAENLLDYAKKPSPSSLAVATISGS